MSLSRQAVRICYLNVFSDLFILTPQECLEVVPSTRMSRTKATCAIYDGEYARGYREEQKAMEYSVCIRSRE